MEVCVEQIVDFICNVNYVSFRWLEDQYRKDSTTILEYKCSLFLQPPPPRVQTMIHASVTLKEGRVVALAVSRWLPTVAARVRVRAACGVCGGQSGTRAGFLRVFLFPLPIIPPISPSS
jgi:hypothetical protein